MKKLFLLLLLSLFFAVDFSAAQSTPTVNGQFYGDGDDSIYEFWQEGSQGSKIYVYFPVPGNDPNLYVALVVDRSMNDNVFAVKDRGGNNDYMISAGWVKDDGTVRERKGDGLMNSEDAAFTLTCTDGTSWSWTQDYVSTGSGAYTADWTSVANNPPPHSFQSSSSIVWNMNNYAADHSASSPATRWDITDGTNNNTDRKEWKSPHDPNGASESDITVIDGYPDTGQITYSSTYEWEWSMVYEWKVDLVSACGSSSFDVLNGGAHHSPSKSGENETFNDPGPFADWGDLPQTYSTDSTGVSSTDATTGGARHLILADGNPYLGAGVDADPEGVPTVGADGDDTSDGNDDEDGITFLDPLIPGSTARIQVVAGTAGFFSGFIDFNNDGTFQSSERVFNDQSLGAGTTTLSFTVPSSVDLTIYSRFRFTQNSGEGGNLSTGEAQSGEVEDYLLELAELGDYVWLDLDEDGVQDSGENGVEGVVVNLLDGSGNPVTDGGGNPVTTTTDSNGNYLFTGLQPGDYQVEFVEPDDFDFTDQNQGGDDTADSDADTGNGRTQVVTLAGGESDLSLDAGLVYEPYDWGDLPQDPYETDSTTVTSDPSTGGPRHLILESGNPFLGSSVDKELEGIPTNDATGDDTDGTDDEDGITFLDPFIAGESARIEVVAGTDGYLSGFIDFDEDGFESNERVFNDENLTAGTHILNVSVPSGSNVSSTIYSRFRFTQSSEEGGNSSTGEAPNGEVEDYRYTNILADWGDLPQTYNTDSTGVSDTDPTTGGARHLILESGNPYLGSSVEADPVGVPSTDALGDDTSDGTDDEDGITFLDPLIPGEFARVEVVAGTAGYLSGFIDFNNDGTFQSSERVFNDQALAAGTITLTFSVPSDVSTTVYSRFRFTQNSGEGGNLSTGEAQSGEVEDYKNLNLVISGNNCYRTLSVPYSDGIYNDLVEPFWTQGVTGSDHPPGPDSNVYVWDTSASGNTGGWTTSGINLASTPVGGSGSGFLFSVFDDDDFDGSPEGFPKGHLLPTNRTAYGTSDAVSPTLNSNADGWTLVGNPFGDPVLFSDLSKTGLTDVGYVYDRNRSGTTLTTEGTSINGQWVSTSSTDSYGDIDGGIIVALQGFFVQNDGSSSHSLTFEHADRTKNGTFYGKQESSEKRSDFVRLELNGETLYSSAWISFPDIGSPERVKGDAYKLYPYTEDYALLASVKGDELFDIGQFPDQQSQQIPLHVEVTRSEEFTLTATDMKLTDNRKLLFVDTQQDVTLPIDESFSYTFNLESNPSKGGLTGVPACGANGQQLRQAMTPKVAMAGKTSGERFYIKVADASSFPEEIPSSVNLYQNYPNPFNPVTQIRYELPQQGSVLLEVYDITGRHVDTLVNDVVSAGSHTVSFDASNLSSGIYLYKLQTANQVYTRKLTVIK